MKNNNNTIKDLIKVLDETQSLSKIGSWRWNIKTGKVNWSKEMYSILGYKPGEVAPSYSITLNHVHPEDKAFYEKTIKKSLDTKSQFNFENRIIDKNKKLKYVISSGKVFLDKNSNSLRMIGTIQDISKRKASKRKAEKEKAEQKLRKSEERLKQSEEKYRIAFLTSPDAVNINRLSNGLYVDINEGFSKIMGYTKKDVIGKTSLELNIWKNPKDRNTLVKNLKKYREVTDFEAEFLTKNNETKCGLMSAKIIQINNVPHILSVTKDITEKKKNQEALRESEEKYRTMFETSREAILIIKDYKFFDCNLATLDKYGFKNKNEIIGKHPWEISPKLQPDNILSKDKAIEKINLAYKGKIQRFYWKHQMNKDSLVDIEVSLNRFFMKETPYLFVMWHDITEKMKAENEFISSANKLKKVINSTSELIASVDINGDINLWNKSIEQKTGCTKKKMIDKNIYDDISYVGCVKIIEIMKKALKTKRVETTEIDIEDKDHNPSTIFFTTSFIRDKDYNISGVVVVGRDISSYNILSKLIFSGLSYILIDKSQEFINKTLNSFTTKEYESLIISRGNIQHLKLQYPKKTEIVLLSEQQYKKISSVNTPESIISLIKNKFKKNKRIIILLDRLEYISTNFGFNELIKLIYKINDLTSLTKNIILVNINSNTFSEKELTLLKQELVNLPKIESEILDEKSKDILKFIGERTSSLLKTKSGDISKEFHLSRATTKKIISKLQIKGFLKVEKQGRSNLIVLTEKSKELSN